MSGEAEGFRRYSVFVRCSEVSDEQALGHRVAGRSYLLVVTQRSISLHAMTQTSPGVTRKVCASMSNNSDLASDATASRGPR